MKIIYTQETDLNDQSVLKHASWDKRLAKFISTATSPALLGFVGIMIAALTINTAVGWAWTAFMILNLLLPPTLYTIWKVKTGEITDFHIRVRKQRQKPLRVLLLAAIATWIIMLIGNAPFLLSTLAAVSILQSLLFLIVSKQWKISAHSSGMAMFSIILWGFWGSLTQGLLLTIPIVIWARVRLGRHTLAQTTVGVIAGSACALIVLYLASYNCTGELLRCISY